MKEFFNDIDHLNRFTLELDRHQDSLHCHHCEQHDQFVSHGFVYKQLSSTSTQVVGKRILCSARYGRSGCGHTFRLYISTRIPTLQYGAAHLFVFLSALLLNTPVKQAYHQATGQTQSRNAWRWLNKLTQRLTHYRILLKRPMDSEPTLFNNRPRRFQHLLPTLELRLRVLSAIDYAPGDSINARIKHVAARAFTDERTDCDYRFTWRTISTWFYRFKRHGITTLDNKTRKDKNSYRKIQLDELAEAINVVIPTLSKNKTGILPKLSLYRQLLKKNYFQRSQLSQTNYYRMVRDNDLLNGEQTQKLRRSFAMQFANELWQADTMYGPSIKQSKEILQACVRLNIHLSHAPIRDGAAKGKIERFFRGFRDRFLVQHREFESLEALNDLTQDWIENDYNSKHHTGIQMVPIDRFNLDQSRIEFLTDDQYSEEIFFIEETRKVSKTNVFSINTQKYECPVDLREKTIQVRYDRTRRNRFIVYFDDKRMGEASLLDLHYNANLRISRGNKS